MVLWEVLGPDRFRVHLFRAGLHETDAALRATLPGGARCGPFYAGNSSQLQAPLLLIPIAVRCQSCRRVRLVHSAAQLKCASFSAAYLPAPGQQHTN